MVATKTNHKTNFIKPRWGPALEEHRKNRRKLITAIASNRGRRDQVEDIIRTFTAFSNEINMLENSVSKDYDHTLIDSEVSELKKQMDN